MNLEQALKEEWKDSVKVKHKKKEITYEIFVNPTTKERRRWDGKRWVPIQ